MLLACILLDTLDKHHLSGEVKYISLVFPFNDMVDCKKNNNQQCLGVNRL